ncbi:hypothetical protein CHH27_13230 [Labrenzia sp. VG12]|nr:hypothetical protein CHH27_13230 [Labrenzia sp. VG12]
MKNLFVKTFAAVLTVGTASAAEIDSRLEGAIRASAANVLTDPYTAVFTFDIVTELSEGLGGKICGTVNAKNAFGAYTGKQFFFAGYAKLNEDYVIIAFDVPGYSLEKAVASGKICM